MDPNSQAESLCRQLRAVAERRFDFASYDRRRMFAPHVVLELAPLGCFGLHAPVEIGGLGLSFEQMVSVEQELASIDVTLAAFIGIHNALGLHPVLEHGSAEQKAGLERFARGHAVLGFALTEPEAGSDPKALATTAQPVPGGYVLNGEKLWIGNAGWAQALIALARIEGEGAASARYAAFLLPLDRPGIEVGQESATLGLRGIVQNHVRLSDVFVSVDEMIGRPGQGLDVAGSAMQFGRLGIAAIATGAMRRAFQLASTYARRRRIAGRLLADRLQVRSELGQFAAETAMLDRAVRFAARRLDRGVALPEQVAIALKVIASERAWHWTDRAMQMVGGRGYDEANLLPRLLRDVRVLRIFEGPTEALQTYLGSTALYSFRALRAGLECLMPESAARERLVDDLAGIRDETMSWIGSAPPAMAKSLIELAGLRVGDVLSWRLYLLCASEDFDGDVPDEIRQLEEASLNRWQDMIRRDWASVLQNDPDALLDGAGLSLGPPAFGSPGEFLATDALLVRN
jgi:alkylation response protein AidB-like acyl-CoA dehydrogenase